MFQRLAGAAGFEPANAGTKNRCLTTWRRPTVAAAYSGAGGCGKPLPSPPGSAQPVHPAVRVGRLAALDRDERAVEPVGHLAGAARADREALVAVLDAA